MPGDIAYDRYVWRLTAIGLVLIAITTPTLEAAHEHHHAEPPAMVQPFHKYEHAPDGPEPMKIAAPRLAVVGTAMVPSTWSQRFG